MSTHTSKPPGTNTVSNTLLVMETILRLQYTMAIAPYFSGGLVYGWLNHCTVSVSTHGIQCPESTAHPAVPRAPGGPALAATTLAAVVTTLNALRRQLHGTRQLVLTEDLTQTTAQDITTFIAAGQASGLAPSTINSKLGLLTAFFDSLCDEGEMAQQPVRRRHRLATPFVLPKPMPDGDLAAFFQVIDSVRDRLIFLFMLRCGLRVSEVCALAWDAIDLHAGTVRVNRGKGQVDRIVYLSPDVEQTLALWRAHHTPGPYLFPSPKPQRAHLFRSLINVLMDQYLAAAGLTRHYSPHCLRHTFATHLLNAGVSLEVLKELMGHHSIQLTLRYAQLDDTTKKHQYEQAMAQVTKRQAVTREVTMEPAAISDFCAYRHTATIRPTPSRIMAGISACSLRCARRNRGPWRGVTLMPSWCTSTRPSWLLPRSTAGSMPSNIFLSIS